MSAEAEKAGAAVLRRPVVGKFLPAHKNDVRHRSQALNIINYGGAAPEADNGREGRADTRNAALTFERFHQGRLFADLVRARAGVPVAIEFFTGAADVVAEKALGVRIVDGLLHDGKQVAIFAADIDVSLLRAHCETGDDNALDDRVRILLEDKAVFAGAGLGFVAVHQNVFWLGSFLGNKAPLHAGREAGATASAKVRSLHLVDDRVRRHRKRLLDGLVAVELEVGVDVGRTFAEPLGNDADFVGMGNQVGHYCFPFAR